MFLDDQVALPCARMGVDDAAQLTGVTLAEALLILDAVEIGVDLCLYPLLLQDREVMKHLSFVLGSAAE